VSRSITPTPCAHSGLYLPQSCLFIGLPAWAQAGSAAARRLVKLFLCQPAVLDESAQTLFLTELFRGLNYTLKSFFDPKVTVGLSSILHITGG
jgi:hypothetical protein